MTKFIVQSLALEGLNAAKSLLLQYEPSSLFLLGNLKQYGTKLIPNEPYSGNFYVIKDHSAHVCAVFCLAAQGNILIETDRKNDYSDVILNHLLKHENIKIQGILGDYEICTLLHNQIMQRKLWTTTAHKAKESLMTIDLTKMENFECDPRCRFLTKEDFSQFYTCRSMYCEELGLEILPEKVEEKQFATRCDDKREWGLFIKKDNSDFLISNASLNTKTENSAMVGGVYTRKEYRRLGYSKMLMKRLMKDVRDVHNLNKIILFTVPDSPAEKLYKSLGFKRIGYFGMFFGK